jgi:hypothetical protein
MNLGKRYGTSRSIEAIRGGIVNGTIRFKERTLQGDERLDTVAGVEYGDGEYWWVIAAASGIGWGLQVPPGTYLRVPVLDDVLATVG